MFLTENRMSAAVCSVPALLLLSQGYDGVVIEAVVKTKRFR
jgi:hypothetical protein